MRNIEMISLAWRNLWRRKSRTVLTVISVVIGAIAIILMLSFGYGIRESTRRQFEQFAQFNAIRVRPTNQEEMPEDPRGSSRNRQKSTKGLLRDAEVRKIQALPHVKQVLPTKNVRYELAFKDETISLWSEIVAIDFSNLSGLNIELEKGQLPASTRKDPFLVGAGVRPMRAKPPKFEMEPLPSLDYVREKPFLKSFVFKEPDNGISIGNKDTIIKLPLTYSGTILKSEVLSPNAIYISFESLERMQKLDRDAQPRGDRPSGTLRAQGRKQPRQYDSATVILDDIKHTEEVMAAIEEMQLSAIANSNVIKSQEESLRVVQWIFAGIGSISLFVAAIGIANTMLMSINERTREIGVMKVIGAQVWDVRIMFLIESMLIGVMGGIIGILLSYGFSYGINNIAQQYMMNMGSTSGAPVSVIPIWLPFAAFGFSMLIGLIAGYLPAKRATQISAIEAIRMN